MSQVYDTGGLKKVPSVGGGGLTNIKVSAGTLSQLLSALTFADSPTVTFGLDAGTITGSAAGGGGGMSTHDSGYHSGNIIPAAAQDFGNFAFSLGTAGVPAASAGRLVFYGFNEQGKTRLGMITPDGSEITHAQDQFIIARNTSGSPISAGKAVYVTGSTGQTPNISPAQADSTTTMPAIGITVDAIANNGFGRVMIGGVADQLDTSAFTEGDRLWVSDSVAGDLTVTEPTYPSLRQRLAIVINSHAVQGKLLVLNTGARGEFGIQAVSAGTTQMTSGGAVFSNSNGVSFGVDGNTVTASHNGLTSQTVQTQNMVSIQGSIGNISFGNANGITFGGNASTVTASHNGLTTAALSNHSHGNPQLNLTNLSGTTASNSGGFTLSLSAAAGGAGNTGSISAGTTRGTLGEIVFSNSNGLAFGINGQTLTGSYTVPTETPFGLSAGTQSVSTGTLVFSNSNNVTFGMSGSSRITASASFPAETPFGISAGTQSVSTGTMVFSNSNGITFGMSGSSRITASHNGLTTAALSDHSHGNPQLNLTNLSGTTASNSAGFTLSLSAAAPGAGGGIALSISGNSTSGGAGYSNITSGTAILAGGPNITLSQDGSVISVSAAAPGGGGGFTAEGYHPYDDLVQVVGQIGQGSLILDPQIFPTFSFDRLGLMIQNTNSSNSSGSHTLRFSIGLYTRNGASLSQLTSWGMSTALTHSGTAGSYSWYSGNRLAVFTVPAQSISADKYWIAFLSSTTFAGANGSYSNNLVSNLASNFTGLFGTASNRSQQPKLGQGFYSTTVTSLPASIAFSQIDGTNSLAKRMAIVRFHSSTY
ncbi:MAG: hypothetical protein AM326_09315 [Candidatus Thorarchaeota archaeon SMTZ-45]|nr:MAG: hypothetical protein AM326_09315 [Candidatus Thorarchaeota archaeon SMTZ-45]